MNVTTPPSYLTIEDLPDSAVVERINEKCRQFEQAWIDLARPRIEDYLEDGIGVEYRPLLGELLRCEFSCRRQLCEAFSLEEYRKRFRGVEDIVDDAWGYVQLSGDAEETQTVDETTERDARSPDTNGDPGLPATFTVQRILGEGGFGQVFLAFDEVLKRGVAVKIPNAGRLAATRGVDSLLSETVDRLLEEARKAARLDHPAIVRVYAAGHKADGLPYIVFEYIEGQSLKERLRLDRRVPWREAAELVAGVAEAIDYAHQHGLVHCDLKPANILLDKTNKPHVTDLGLALYLAERSQRAGHQVGTLAYMAPEQVTGDADSIDGRADVWALGVILYELLAERRPFRSDCHEQLAHEIREDEPSPLQELNQRIPEPLARVCAKCLAKSPGDRFQNAADLARALRRTVHPNRRKLLLSALAAGLLSTRGFGLWEVAAWGNQERQVAVWALNRGGQVTLHGRKDPLNQLSALPAQPFLIQSIDLFVGGGEISDDELRDLRRLRALQGLFTSAKPISEEGLATIGEFTALHWLSLVDAGRITDRSLPRLGKLANLEFLVLTGAPVKGESLGHLTGLRRLKWVNFSSCERLSDESLRHLAQLRSVETLLLRKTSITDRGLQHLVGTRLKTLVLDDTNVGDEGLKHLSQLNDLLTLGLAGSNVSDAAVPVLAGMTQLQRLAIGDTNVSRNGRAALQAALPKCNIQDTFADF